MLDGRDDSQGNDTSPAPPLTPPTSPDNFTTGGDDVTDGGDDTQGNIDTSPAPPVTPPTYPDNSTTGGDVNDASPAPPVIAPPIFIPPWTFILDNLRFVLVTNSTRAAATAAALAISVPAGMPSDVITLSSTDAKPAVYQHLKPTAAMLELEQLMRATTIQTSTYIEAQGEWGGEAKPQPGSSSGGASVQQKQRQQQQQAWWKLQQKYGWPDGQVVFESLYAPCPVKPGECAESCG
jgi:hypothetical protein